MQQNVNSRNGSGRQHPFSKKPIGQTILVDQNMDRLGFDMADQAAMYTQQVVVST